jgi:hypothetical protein
MSDETVAIGALAGTEGLVASGASGSGDAGTGAGVLLNAVGGDAGTAAAADGSDAFAPVAAGGATGVDIVIAWFAGVVTAAGGVVAIAGDGVGAAPGGVDGGATMPPILDEVTGVMPDGATGAVVGTDEELVGPAAVAAGCAAGAGLAALRAGTGATS